MKHLTYGDKSLLVGDEIADLIIQYAAALANVGRADAVEVHAMGSDGNDVTATVLLDAGAPLMVETSSTTVVEPDNATAIDYVRGKLPQLEGAIGGTSTVMPADDADDFPHLERTEPPQKG